MAAAQARKADPAAAAAADRAKAAEADAQPWFNHSASKPTEHRQGIGKYIAPKLLSAAEADGGGGGAGGTGGGADAVATPALSGAFADPQHYGAEPPKKKPRGGGGFGNFAGW